MQNNRLITTVILLLISLMLACNFFGEDPAVPANQLTVLAGSELKDLEPLFGQIAESIDLHLDMQYVGTLDGAERLLGGEQYDLAWFSHGKYLSLLDESGLVKSQERTMLSPVVLGIKQSLAQQWDWVDNPDLTWQDIAEKADSGELQYAMTNPASSNSGFTALVGLASAFSGSADALTIDKINIAELQRFFKGQILTAGSSGWLADSYVNQQDELDGMVNYESVLLALNESDRLQEPFYLIYPKEGIITADYPLMLLNDDKREMYTKLVEYLRTPEFQKTMMQETLRRPAIPQVQPSNKFSDQLLIELPFPNNVEVINELIFSYLDEQRRPSHAFFVLDISGSMYGDRLDKLKAAFKNLTGLDSSLTGQFARFRERERVTIITFNQEVHQVNLFTIDDVNQQGTTMTQIRTYVDGLEADGGTAIYTALSHAYQLAGEAQQQEPDRYYSIVLMSDGENTDGISKEYFLTNYGGYPLEMQHIRTFPILFGDTDEAAMNDVANRTEGRVFDANRDSLSFIFKQIRGYQ